MALPIKHEIRVIKKYRNEQAKDAIVFIVSSASDARKHYTVTHQGNRWMCSCPVWIYHRKSCKHIHRAQRREGKTL